MCQAQVIDRAVSLGACKSYTLKRDPSIECRCAVCWHPSFGLFRIFPVSVKSSKIINRWNLLNIVAYPNGDWRRESYKLLNSKDLQAVHRDIHGIRDIFKDKILKIPLEERINIICNMIPKYNIDNGCSGVLNLQKRSLGLVCNPRIESTYFKDGQYKIRYSHDNCKIDGNHDQTVVDWTLFQLIDKSGTQDPDYIADAYKLYDDDYYKYFIVGNQVHATNSFIIVTILYFKKMIIDEYLKKINNIKI